MGGLTRDEALKQLRAMERGDGYRFTEVSNNAHVLRVTIEHVDWPLWRVAAASWDEALRLVEEQDPAKRR